MLFVVFILLITSMYFNLDEYIKIELILFLITWITVFISMIIFEHEEKIIKNNQGNEIYMKLNGLKKYIKDFGNFEERELDEINIWEEYILYAIILNEGKTIKNESKTELQSLIEIIYKWILKLNTKIKRQNTKIIYQIKKISIEKTMILIAWQI